MGIQESDLHGTGGKKCPALKIMQMKKNQAF